MRVNVNHLIFIFRKKKINMNKDDLLKILKYSEDKQIPEKYAAKELGFNYNLIYYYKKKYGITTNKIGYAKFTNRYKKIYFCDDNFFEKPNLLNCYYAGFIAADGNIYKNKILSFGLAKKDDSILIRFKNDIKYNGIIRYGICNGYEYCNLTINSIKICSDLYKNFNITPQKSLTLLPPNLESDDLIDAFICGYIDGDGSIGIYNHTCRDNISVQMLGTKEMLLWIKKRFECILNNTTGNLYHNNFHNKNTYSYSVADKKGRCIFQHFYHIKVPKLCRKWNDDIYDFCSKYEKNKPLCIRKGVNVFDLNGNLIQCCETLKEAMHITNVPCGRISNLCKMDDSKHMSNGYMFSRNKIRMNAYEASATTNIKLLKNN